MTDLTDDQVRALLDEWDEACKRGGISACQPVRDKIDALSVDLARALLDARAELARVKTDAAVAVAEAIRRAAENKEQLDIWAQEILEGLSFADVLKITSYDDKIEAHNMVGRGLVDVILNLAPADALAEVQRLRVEARENAMQALASMGQAQEAYEAQLEAEAELAAANAREAGLRKALEVIREWTAFPPSGRFWRNGDGTISARPMPYGAAFGSNGERDFMRQVARAALAQPSTEGEA